MRKLILCSAVALSGFIALSACHPVERHRNFSWTEGHHGDNWESHPDTPVSVAAALNCPDHQGDLDRISVASDGRSCQYNGDSGEEVTLRLVALNNQTPQAALAPTEGELRGLVPAPTGSIVNINANHGPGGTGDNAKIDLPFLHIDAHKDKADIRIFGADIKADGDKADVHTDMGRNDTSIHAGPGGAEIRAGNVGAHSAQLVYILAGDNPGPNGYRAVGYIARGPSAGPLVVGEFKSRHGGRDDHQRDLERLIDLNVTPSDAT